MAKFKILKAALATMAIISMSSVAVLAQDETELTLEITPGQLTVTSPATAALNGVSISKTDQNATANLVGVNVTDLRGTNAGWNLAVNVENLSLGTPSADDNILMGNAADVTGGAAYSGTSYLSITNTNLARVGTFGGDSTDLALTASPLYETLTTLDNTGKTGDMTILVAESNEGAGEYTFDTNVDITIPAFGDYNITPRKFIGGGSYSGTMTFTFI